MKKQVKRSTSGQKNTGEPVQRSSGTKIGTKTKPGKKPIPRRTPSTKIGKKKKVVKKRKIVRRPLRKKGRKKEDEQLPEDVKWLEDDPHDEILSRFIFNSKGTQMGETIGVEGKQLIIKNREKFYSIPLNSIKEKNDELTLVKKINWKRAEKKGEKWRKKALDVIKPKK
jgi:hypothetical protein